jgi:threonine/homoserine/homoserine lactone efflux protein
MHVQLWLAFVATSVLILVIPGPTVLTVISYSIANGRRAGLPIVAGVALGDSVALGLSLLGLGALLAASAFWFTVVKWIGGVYLIVLGLRLLRAGVQPAVQALDAPPRSRTNLFFSTWLVAALNPKAAVFYIAFLPQFVDPHGDPTRQLWILAVTFVILASLNTLLFSVFASSASSLLASPRARKRFHAAGGSMMCAAGVWALLARRPA